MYCTPVERGILEMRLTVTYSVCNLLYFIVFFYYNVLCISCVFLSCSGLVSFRQVT